jgi:hypothetical protein
MTTCTKLPPPCKRKTHLTGGRLPPNQAGKKRPFLIQRDISLHLEGSDLSTLYDEAFYDHL